jgi:hypothetical protein
MAKQGISTGTTPNDGTGDTLLSGAIKINDNFNEVYNLLGDGNILTGIVTSITAGSNITVSGSTGNVTINASGGGGGISAVVDDTSPQLGGNLDLNNKFITGTGGINISGVTTATSFSGSASNLTGLTGASAATYGNSGATPVIVVDANGKITGISTVAIGPPLSSRTTVTGLTTSIANNGIGNTDITGFKSYSLMKVGLSTAGWLRLYADSSSRTADISRSVGIDPAPGSGVIAEVVTTGISTTQIITPFVMGGNLNNPADATIYASITNLSGSTQAITANLTILQLEA